MKMLNKNISELDREAVEDIGTVSDTLTAVGNWRSVSKRRVILGFFMWENL